MASYRLLPRRGLRHLAPPPPSPTAATAIDHLTSLITSAFEFQPSDLPSADDDLLKALISSQKPNRALALFRLMLRSQILPQTDSCYRLLSSFVKLKQLDKAWIVYAEMFRSRIRSTVHTFNIMINVLCKQVKCEASPVARLASQELSSNITPCPPPPVVVVVGGAGGGLGGG